MIDSKLQEELRERFNPEGSDLRKMQLRMLEMLKYIDKICRENNIKYWLSSGSCLGAVRHGGFIPWDDDLDVEMEKTDYDKLMKILSKTNNSQYKLQNYNTDNEYVHKFSKLRDAKSNVKENNSSDLWNKYSGCWIDIFSLEPSRFLIVNKVCGFLWWHTVVATSKIKTRRLRRFLHLFFRIIYSGILFPILSILQKYGSKNILRHRLGVCFFYSPRFLDDIAETIYVPFEGLSVPIPKGYDHYLREMYGEYEKLPDLDKIAIHNSVIKIFE